MHRGNPHVLHHKIGEVKPNIIGIHYQIAKPISDALNILLASSFVLYHQVKKHQWVAAGLYPSAVERHPAEFSVHLEQIADHIARRIIQLGAYPISTPRKQQEMAIFPVEEEGVFDRQTILQHDVKGYQLLIVRYRETILQAQQAGDYATEQLLKTQLLVLEEDAHQLHRVQNDTPVLIN